MTVETNGVVDEKQRGTIIGNLNKEIDIGRKTLAFLETAPINGMRAMDMLNCMAWVKHMLMLVEDQKRKLELQ